jgi:hypothetical protein
MSLTRAVADWKRFSSNEGTIEITFYNPSSTQSVTVQGLVSDHNLSINEDTGQVVNSRNAHCSVAESNLTDEGYVTRVNGKISLRNHRVTFSVAEDTDVTYQIKEIRPSRTTGMIVCTLELFES